MFCLPPGSKAKVCMSPDMTALPGIQQVRMRMLLTIQGPLFFWSYCYYLSKYYELLDTAILVVKVCSERHELIAVSEAR